ncbi:Transcriptional regulator, AraC family [Fulvivirga imtechensis AK7]|uniref:Transcriptional regulator, AraC family n=1 Tax=Fulvivirga imtechensis AK7 TaxID=1237149 RepID=L8JSI7_9BACT|nr:AraC family transcriptional regulator [Fulvivirga imtechensis]ELR71168.1 Transcriptional regulator, AraC family [Fulvivirga imtechensis AK7]
MKARVTNINIEEFQFESRIHREAVPVDPVFEKTAEFNHRFGRGKMRDCLFQDMHFMEMDLFLEQETEVTFVSELPALELQFNLEGSYFHPDNKVNTEPLPTQQGTHNILFFPPIQDRFVQCMGARKNKVLEIHLTQKYFTSLLERNFPQAADFLRKMENMEFAGMHSHHLSITGPMTLLINDILNCNKTGTLRKLYFEARILELLMLQLEQIEGLERPVNQLSRYDVERLQEAKWIVENNMEHPYSIPQLATKVGINEFKLKKGFKQLFKNTVFGYIFDIRMEQARELLLESNKSITEIADIIGYKNAHHFSTAFKRKYGMLPSKMRTG